METNKRAPRALVTSVRRTDIEPYTALKWVGTLFKSAAIFLAIAVVGEFIAGIRFEGMRALPILMGELARTVVMAVVLWGAGDLTRLLITVGNDIRAERILLARLIDRTPAREKLTEPNARGAEPAPDIIGPGGQGEEAA
ncbi:MAG: hypothetical protein ACRENP_00190 [Longimicrobiales bacterium]